MTRQEADLKNANEQLNEIDIEVAELKERLITLSIKRYRLVSQMINDLPKKPYLKPVILRATDVERYDA